MRRKKYINIVVGLMILSSTTIFANDNIELITLADKQRMLSQRIAKDYLYVGKGIAFSKANKQLKKSLDSFLENYKKMLLTTNDPDIKNLLEFVKLSLDDLRTITTEKFSVDNAQLILDLTESMFEGSRYIYFSLRTSTNLKESENIFKASQQLILSQRIAKYYIAYQLGIKDVNSVNSMKKTVNRFSKNLDFLLKTTTNTPQINKKLNEVDKLWKIVHKFYNNIEKGGLPLIVFNTTDSITRKMDEITKMYFASHK